MLLTELRAAGLTVNAYPGWDIRTMNGRDRTETVGIVNHWDAIKGEPDAAYYTADPPHNRFQGDIYHIVIRRDGTVELLQQRYAWHAGSGSSDILGVAQAGGPVPNDAAGPDDTNGNPHFFSVCVNYHPDEGPLPQYEALVVVNRVLANHFNLSVGQVFRHMDWTTRKRDIDTINLEQFRKDIHMAAPNIDEASSWAKNSWEWAYEQGLITVDSHPKDDVTVEQLMVFLKRYDGT